MAELGTLVVDEALYLHATKMLARLEGGENRYALYDAARDFIEDPAIHERFELAVGREFREERAVARGFIGAIYTPEHHNLYWEEYFGDVENLDQPAADFIRTAMWSFLTAWTHRYGGIAQDLVKSGTLVDPSLHDPPSP